MPADHKFGALQGLLALRRAHGLSRKVGDAVRSMEDIVGPQIWGAIDTGVLRVTRLAVLANALTHDEELEVVAACRSSKQEVRVVAVLAIADLLKARHSSTAAWALVGVLYDPTDDVMERGLQAVGQGALGEHPDAAEVATAAVVSAYRTGRPAVRTASVHAAARLADPAARRLVRTASGDRSWLVRRAAVDVTSATQTA